MQQNNVPKAHDDTAQRKQIEMQLKQIEEAKKHLETQAKTIDSERKMFEEQRYVVVISNMFKFKKKMFLLNLQKSY